MPSYDFLPHFSVLPLPRTYGARNRPWFRGTSDFYNWLRCDKLKCPRFCSVWVNGKIFKHGQKLNQDANELLKTASTFSHRTQTISASIPSGMRSTTRPSCRTARVHCLAVRHEIPSFSAVILHACCNERFFAKIRSSTRRTKPGTLQSPSRLDFINYQTDVGSVFSLHR